MNNKIASSVDEYIAGFPKNVQVSLNLIRQIVKDIVPEVEEAIKYSMPAFLYKGNLLYFAAFKKHIGLYSVPTEEPSFQKAFSSYKTGEGSIQIPLEQPVPRQLIERIVRYRMKQNGALDKGRKRT